MELEYGKKTTTESYFNGKIKSIRTEYSIPKLIQDKAQALNESMKAIELLTSKQTNNLTLVIECDPKTGNFKMITKKYIVML